MKNSLLDNVSLFEGVKRKHFEGIVPHLKKRCHRQNEVLYNDGDDSKRLYFIFSGQVDIS
jgi:CRP-like cAMP-binding protein